VAHPHQRQALVAAQCQNTAMATRPDIPFELPDDLVIGEGGHDGRDGPSSTLPQDLFPLGTPSQADTPTAPDGNALASNANLQAYVRVAPSPAAAAPAGGILAPPRLRRPLPHDGLQPKKVLVVDDDLTARLYMRSRLMLRGHVEIFEATDGQQGIAMAREQAFDAILLDVDMGEISGYEVCRAIRQQMKQDQARPARIYIITSRSSVVDKMRAKMAGADAFLSKPPFPAQLAQLLESL
jgi:CheY-like chemotaxis protein